MKEYQYKVGDIVNYNNGYSASAVQAKIMAINGYNIVIQAIIGERGLWEGNYNGYPYSRNTSANFITLLTPTEASVEQEIW